MDQHRHGAANRRFNRWLLTTSTANRRPGPGFASKRILPEAAPEPSSPISEPPVLPCATRCTSLPQCSSLRCRMFVSGIGGTTDNGTQERLLQLRTTQFTAKDQRNHDTVGESKACVARCAPPQSHRADATMPDWAAGTGFRGQFKKAWWISVRVCVCVLLWHATSINSQYPMLWGFGTQSSYVNRFWRPPPPPPSTKIRCCGSFG